MRREVREMELNARSEMVRRLRQEQINLKELPETDADQKNAKLTAIAETETTLQQLQANPPIGRVVIHVQSDVRAWRNTVADVPVRDGDVLVVPKKADYVTVNGQVFNSTAVSYRPGRSAKWYLSQAGGMTQLANRKAVFVIRADGSIVGGQTADGWFSGSPLGTALRPGDMVVVPEKATGPNQKWKTLMQTAMTISSIGTSAAIAAKF